MIKGKFYLYIKTLNFGIISIKQKGFELDNEKFRRKKPISIHILEFFKTLYFIPLVAIGVIVFFIKRKNHTSESKLHDVLKTGERRVNELDKKT